MKFSTRIDKAVAAGRMFDAMAGFDLERSYQQLQVNPEKYTVVAAIAIGRRDNPEDLPEDLLAMEAPNNRKASSEVAVTASQPFN